MSRSYKKALELLKKWPVNSSRGTTDFGLYLQQKIKGAFPTGEIFPGGPVQNEKMIDSLLRIAENRCGKQYEPLKMGGTGIEKEHIHRMLDPKNFKKIAKIKKTEE